MSEPSHGLSPRRTRILVLIALVVIAVFAIWLIDRRAMIRMWEMETAAAQTRATTP